MPRKGVIKDSSGKIVITLFTVLTVFWLYLNFFQESGSVWHDVFTNVYCSVALIGGIFGVIAAKRWGGFKSLIGKSSLFFSFGLFAQVFGQLSYNYYIYVLGVEVPYPSIGDIGFLGYVPLYLYGMWCLGQAIGLKVSLRSTGAKLFALVTPIIVLAVTIWYFLHGYEFDWSAPLTVILDFGYPIMQAFNISALLVTYILSRKYMGGIMKGKVLFLLFAYFMQYIADFTFLYQVNRDAWSVGGINDYMYLLSYFLMAIALIQLKTTFDSLKSK